LVFDPIFSLCIRKRLRPKIPKIRRMSAKLERYQMVDLVGRVWNTVARDAASMTAGDVIATIRFVFQTAPERALWANTRRIATRADRPNVGRSDRARRQLRVGQ